ncbi:hypothetical protein K4K48_013325 [Colletotrichum sp. SAR 10_66]|nr:hypothetical protein K4K48_013325 [Colletotrichum sp. SAR 10_66]
MKAELTPFSYNSVIFSTLSSVDYQAALVTQDFLKGAAWNDTELAMSVHAWSGLGTANVWTHKAEDTDTSENWLCHGNVGNYDNSGSNCDFNNLVAHASSWKIEGVCRDTSNSGSCGSSFDAPILYCLAEQFPGNCKIQVSTTLLTIVILFNAVKVVCLLTTAFSRKFEPLGTVGDAISSFLEQPDDKTTNLGPVTKSVVQKQSWKKAYISGSRNMSLTYKRKPHRWARAGFNTSPANTIEFTLGNSLISNVLLANTPQIVISFVYLFYNNVFTCMVMAHEYARFASVRKPLRVTRPYGEQRSTFWLQLPYRYIVPIMVIMAFMHWSVSRSIYLVQLEIYDNNGELIAGRSVTGCLSARKLDPGMPIAGSCSLVISAAAHAGQDEVDAAARHLQYGVISEDDTGGRDRRRVGFSSRPVEKLVDGETYA